MSCASNQQRLPGEKAARKDWPTSSYVFLHAGILVVQILAALVALNAFKQLTFVFVCVCVWIFNGEVGLIQTSPS